MSDQNEKTYLRELIQTFPPPNPPDVEEAWKTTVTRFAALESNIGSFVGLLRSSASSSYTLLNLISVVHKYLFDGIFSNAGEYRKQTDPNGGVVFFGAERPRNPSASQFKGVPPPRIETELHLATRSLSEDDPDPIRSSLLFYQRFAFAHPFYDGNGRISRFIVTLYLRYHGMHLRWRQLETHKAEFFKKLNNCHHRVGQ